MAESESPERSELAAEIENQVEEWSTSSNDALRISLFRGDKAVAEFGPAFTYPIFGEEEVVFGYRGLDMSLSFAAHNLKPHMSISWQQQFPQLGDIKASDIRGTLDDFVPESAFTKEPRSEALADPDAATFTPPGSLLHSYINGQDKFEIWHASLTDPGAKELLENAQVLVPLFIEGGSILQLDEPWITRRWTLFLLYQVHEKEANSSPYTLVGYSTSFRVFTLPDRRDPAQTDLTLLSHGTDFDTILKQWNPEAADDSAQTLKSPMQLPSRERISQFLILPTYQGSGHGARLYSTMFKTLIAPDNVCELTVEDPNEAFDDMRDVCDLLFLRQHNDDFASLAINSNVDAKKLKPKTSIIPVDDIVDGNTKDRIKKSSKIMPRQLGRLVEMQTLSKIPQNHRSVTRITKKENSSNEMDRAYYFWRLYVKQRLYISNRDVLTQLDHEERVEKLDATVENVQADYDRLIALAEKRAQLTAAESPVEAENKNSERKRRRIKVVIADEDDDEEADDDEILRTSTKKKKRKTA